MNYWLLSDEEQSAKFVQSILAQVDVQSALPRIVSTSSAKQVARASIEPLDIVFLITANFSQVHLDLLRTLKAATQAKLIVVSAVAENTTILQAIRAGASDCLQIAENLDKEITDLLLRTATERQHGTADGQLITIVPCQGPSDATLLAVNLAASICQRDKGCGLIDLQLRGGDLTTLLHASPHHTLYDLLNQRESLDDAMIQQAIVHHASGIKLLAGPPLFSDLRTIQPNECQKILDYFRSIMPFTIANSEDVVHAEQVRALACSDEIVLCMRLDLMSLTRAQKHLEYFRENHVDLGQVQVVAIGTGCPGELSMKSVEKLLGLRQLHCIPSDPIATTMSINIGNPMVLESPKSKASMAIVRLAGDLTGHSMVDIGAIGWRKQLNRNAAAFFKRTGFPMYDNTSV